MFILVKSQVKPTVILVKVLQIHKSKYYELHGQKFFNYLL